MKETLEQALLRIFDLMVSAANNEDESQGAQEALKATREAVMLLGRSLDSIEDKLDQLLETV